MAKSNQSDQQMIDTMSANLAEKTGKSMAQWVALGKNSGEARHGGIVKHLKTEHGLTHGYANLVAHTYLGSLGGDGDDLVGAQYAGTKAGLKPIYDELVANIQRFGKDAEISPKKTYVSLRRNKQFGLIQPSTAKRIDVGLHLKGVTPTDRLEASGSFNSMVSHRVRLESKKDVDAELIGWLKQAYESA